MSAQLFVFDHSISVEDVLGNFFADSAAKGSAKVAFRTLPKPASEIIQRVDMAIRIGQRIAQIEAMRWRDGPTLLPVMDLTDEPEVLFVEVAHGSQKKMTLRATSLCRTGLGSIVVFAENGPKAA